MTTTPGITITVHENTGATDLKELGIDAELWVLDAVARLMGDDELGSIETEHHVLKVAWHTPGEIWVTAL